MGQFSLEYLFDECNNKHHCLCVRLKQPILYKNVMREEVFVLEVLLTDDETRQVITNIGNVVNTNSGTVKSLAFVDGQSPFEAEELHINLSNIEHIEKR